jgi:hypothetical protein
MITTAGAIKTIIEDPLLSILEEDPNKTKPTGQIRGPCLDHNSPSPGFKLFMKNLISHLKISMVLGLRFPFGRFFSPLLRQFIHWPSSF